MNNNRLDCAIVRDLLSLYHDQVVSDTTKAAVESHLEGCESCRHLIACRGGARCVTYAQTGRLDVRDVNCRE